MKQIYLIRHGESAANIDPTIHDKVADHAIALSPKGIQQAAEAGKRLSRILANNSQGPIRVWTSPYRRTRETAEQIVEQLKQEPRLFTGNRPIWDVKEHILLSEQQFGLFDGIPDDELFKRYPNEAAHYAKNERFEGRFWARMPLGESRFDVAVRVHQAFGTFHRDADRHGIETIVVVGHGVTIRAFIMMWCHLSPEWFEKEPNPANCCIRLIENGEDRGYL